MLAVALGLWAVAGPESDPSQWWTAPPDCPSQDEVAALIEDESGEPISADLDVRASVAQTGERWTLSVDVARSETAVHRTLELDSCAAAAEATALIYAVAASELSEAAVPEPEPEPVVPPSEPAPEARPAAAADPSAPASPPPPPTDPDPPLRGLVTLGGGPRFGGPAPVAGGLEVGVGLQVWRLRFGLYGGHDFGRRFAVQDVAARISATTGGIRVGVPIPLGVRFELEPAVVGRAGGLRAQGSGGLRARTRWVAWGTVGLAAALSVDIVRGFGLRLDGSVDVPLVRHTFTFDDLVVHQTGQIAGRVTLGLQFRFSTGRR